MGKSIRLGLAVLCLAICAAAVTAPADSYARNDAGQGSYFAFVKDGIGFTSNCLSKENPRVLLPEWTAGSSPDTVTVDITLTCQGGSDSGAIAYLYDTQLLRQVSVEYKGETADEVFVAQGTTETLQLIIVPDDSMTESKDVTIQVQWQASSGTQMAEFVLPVVIPPVQEEQIPEVLPREPEAAQQPSIPADSTPQESVPEESIPDSSDPDPSEPSETVPEETVPGEAKTISCYRDSRGVYRLLSDGTAAKISPLSGKFPAFTWYSEDEGNTWTVLAYETDFIATQADIQALRFRGEGFAGGLKIELQNGEILQTDPAALCTAAMQITGSMPVVSDRTTVSCTIQASGVTVSNYKVIYNGTLCSIQESKLELVEQARSTNLTIGAPNQAAQAGVYILVATVYDENFHEIDELQTTFFVNYRYIG